MAFANKTDKKGFGFEYAVLDMFQIQGYLARKGVPLQYGHTNQDATDVDVLGIKFTGLFQKHIIVCDCKNKARSKPYERIFWAKGLGEFVKASSVFVALNKTQPEIIRFAETGGVKVLTSDIIYEYTKTGNAYGLADASYFEEYGKILEKTSKQNSTISSIYINSKKLYLYENPYLALNIAISDINKLLRELKIFSDNDNDFNKAIRFLICELTSIVGVQILSISSDVLGLPERARREHIRNKLTFGEMEPKTVLHIMKNARDLANEVIKSSVPKSVAPQEVDFGEIIPPAYSDSVIGLVERALLRPRMYLTIPQHLDFILFEQGLKGKEYTEENFVDIFGYGMADERVKASRNILAFIKSTCELNWKLIWEKSRKNVSEYSQEFEVKEQNEIIENETDDIQK